MSELLAKMYALLIDVILPSLRSIQASQAEQRAETDRLSRNIEEFRAEMQIRSAEIRAEMALCRQEIEDTMVVLRECDEADRGSDPLRSKRRMFN